MPPKLTTAELLEVLNSPEAKEALKGTKQGDKLKELLADIEIGEDDDATTLAKKFNKRISELVNYFEEKSAITKESAVKEATQSSRDKENAEIAEFTKNNPGMKDDDVLALMQPLYNKGKPLADCYEVACRAMDYNPETGAVYTEDERKAKENPEKKEKKKDKETPPKRTSLKSDASDDLDDTDEEEIEKEKKHMSLRDTLNATANKLDAANPDLFKDD